MAYPYFYKLGQLKWGTKPQSAKYSSVPGGASVSFQDRTSSDDDSSDGLLEKGGSEPADIASPRQPIWRNSRFLAAHGVLFSVYMFVLFLVANRNATSTRYSGMPFSPARDILTYEDTAFTLEDRIQDGSLYTGKPSEQLDKAWHDLLNDENILLEPEYIENYGRLDTSVEVPEGGRYLGTLNVYHELHCLKRIHQFMYSDYYFPDISEHQKDVNRLHNEHCIDFLRQSAMCHGDIGLITYSWHMDQLMPVANATSHQCVNWDTLASWTHDRAVDMMKPGWLMHPTRGPAYPDGQGDKIGAAESPHFSHDHGGH
ncbi:hypothetical protein BJ170DRAFT_107728 [Xylariales sp. AK1849]|nr:hypothetical protein BJ170DRAFT_107728 [Xylariales sp. AK1849]